MSQPPRPELRESLARVGDIEPENSRDELRRRALMSEEQLLAETNAAAAAAEREASAAAENRRRSAVEQILAERAREAAKQQQMAELLPGQNAAPTETAVAAADNTPMPSPIAPSPKRRARLALIPLVLLAVVSVTGCRTVHTALSEGRDVVSTGVDGAVRATTQLTDACLIAQTAWLPGVTPQEAHAALRKALALVDNVIQENADFPGASALRATINSAQDALDSPDGAFGTSRERLQQACTFVNHV